MPTPMDTFEVNLSALEKIATQDLPSIVSALRATANMVMTHEGLEGPGHLDAVYAMEGAYAHFTDSVGSRQRLGHKIIDMYTKAGVFISAGANRNAVIDSLHQDADMFTSLDPQKIVDEFQRMQRGQGHG